MNSTDLTSLLNSPVKVLNASSIIDVEIDVFHINETCLLLVCPKEYREQVKISFYAGELNVSAKGNFNKSSELKVILRVSSLNEIKLSGVSAISGLYSGSNLNIKSSGTGDIKLSGYADDLNVKVSGTGDCLLSDLKSKNVELILSGTSDAEVYASNKCSVNVSGVGDAIIYGNPEIFSQKVSGLGNVTKVVTKNKTKESFANRFSSNNYKRDVEKFDTKIYNTKIQKFNSRLNENEKTKFKVLKSIEEIEELKNDEVVLEEEIEELKNDEVVLEEKKIPSKEVPSTKNNLSVSQRLKNKFKSLL